jgi:hypothetical protein
MFTTQGSPKGSPGGSVAEEFTQLDPSTPRTPLPSGATPPDMKTWNARPGVFFAPATPATPVTPASPDLVQVHASSSSTSPYPDAGHQKKSQEKNRDTVTVVQQESKKEPRKRQRVQSDDAGDISSLQKSLKDELTELNGKIRRAERNLQRAQLDEKQEKRVAPLSKSLKELRLEKTKLEKKIAANDASSDYVTSSESESDSDSAPSISAEKQVDALAEIRKMLADRKQELVTLSTTITGLMNTPNSQAKITKRMAEISVMQNEIATLEKMLKHFDGAKEGKPGTKVENKAEGKSSTASTAPQRTDDSKPQKKSTFSELIRTRTTRRPPPPNRSPKPPEKNSGKKIEKESTSESDKETEKENSEDSESMPSSLRNMQENLRNSTLIMPEDMKKRLSQEGLKLVEKLDSEIADAADEADIMAIRAAKLEAQLKRMRNNSASNKEDLRTKEKALKEIHAKQRKYYLAAAKLIEAREKLEKKELPQDTPLSPKEIEEAYKALLDGVKSDITRALEKVHTDLLADLERTTNASHFSTIGYQALAGAAAFSVSFFISNTAFRFVPAPLVWIAWIGAPVVAGTLHVITATPMAKQVMTRAWTSNALAELNNNFKLRGSSWGDWWRGESNVPKYVSKDPAKAEKITIAERLKEEKPFLSLLGERYRTEEAAYFAYTMNYLFKAVAASSISYYLAGGSWAAKGVEAAMHGMLGAFSGAEYLMLQQEGRSKHPNAKQAAVPTRECYAAEAAALDSLRTDLQNKLTVCRNQKDKDPNDKTERNLAKALRKTEKALIVATLRSGKAGTFRYEWGAQFSQAAWRDTLSESLGRILSLLPTDVVGEFTRPWRASPDPLLMFLGHALPAVALIAPPGFTARPVYSGAIRGLLQAFDNGREKKTVVTRPPALQFKETEDSSVGSIDSSASRRSSDEDIESVVVGTEDGSDDESDDAWEGNPTDRDLHQDNVTGTCKLTQVGN